jgi:hypothetical protein
VVSTEKCYLTNIELPWFVSPDPHRCTIRLCTSSRALEEPIRQISINAGGEGSIVVQKVCDSKETNYGYNARTDEYEDLVAAGVIDPTKVTRTALQNASSIAGLLLTTEAVVTESRSPRAVPPPCRAAAAAWATCTEPVGRKAERIRWMNGTGGGPQALRRFLHRRGLGHRIRIAQTA